MTNTRTQQIANFSTAQAIASSGLLLELSMHQIIKDFSANVDTSDCTALMAAPRAS